MKNFLSFSLLCLFALIFAACGAPTPEDLCAKAEKKDECTKKMNEMKEAFGDDLWKEFAKCAKDKDMNKDGGKEIVTCLNGDMIAKITELKKAGKAPGPEDLCDKVVDKKDDCIKAMKELKKGIGKDLWTEFANCAKDKDASKDEGKELMVCLSGDMINKMMEAEGKKDKPPTPPPATNP